MATADDTSYDLGREPERDSSSKKAKQPKAKPKPKADQAWRQVADAVDRMLPPVPLVEVADKINMENDALAALVTGCEVWEVFSRFTPDGDYMTNWVTSQNDYGSQTELVATTRDIVKTNFTLRFFIAFSGFHIVMDSWIAAFVAHCRSNALFKWIVPKKRFYVQTGQTMPPQSLPPMEGFSCPARMSFKEWDEYCPIHGFHILEAMEIVEKVGSRIPAVALRLVHMPGAINKSQPTSTRAYFAAIHETHDSNEDEFTTRLSDLKEGERLGVCFNTRLDSRLEDWRALVVSTVDGDQDEHIIALIRPFNKAEGKYVDIPLESPEPIRLGTVKNRNDLRRS